MVSISFFILYASFTLSSYKLNLSPFVFCFVCLFCSTRALTLVLINFFCFLLLQCSHGLLNALQCSTSLCLSFFFVLYTLLHVFTLRSLVGCVLTVDLCVFNENWEFSEQQIKLWFFLFNGSWFITLAENRNQTLCKLLRNIFKKDTKATKKDQFHQNLAQLLVRVYMSFDVNKLAEGMAN